MQKILRYEEMQITKVMSYKNIEAALKKIGRLGDDNFEIGEAALLLAAMDEPNSDISFYRDHLVELANDVKNLMASMSRSNLDSKIEAIAQTIAKKFNYRGDQETYDDPQNANLMRVITRRRGLPVGLAIIYLDVAHRLGWEATGINFPGHFLIRLQCASSQKMIDPFNGGMERKASDLRGVLKQIAGKDAELLPQHYSPVSCRETLIRLLNNIKLRAISSNNPSRAMEIMERMRLIAPTHWTLLQEISLFYSKIGHLRQACAVLENFLGESTVKLEREQAAVLLRRVRADLN
tara:strand:+ start:168 stop:1046 length:879 start_codon:yes stop_codon:yes gene_type:complete